MTGIGFWLACAVFLVFDTGFVSVIRSSLGHNMSLNIAWLPEMTPWLHDHVTETCI